MGRGARLSHAALRTPSDWGGRGLQVGGLATSWADPWPKMSKTSLDEGLCDVTCEHPTTGPSLATVLKGKPLASVPHVRCRGQTSLLSGRRAARVWPAAAWLVCGCTAPGSGGGEAGVVPGASSGPQERVGLGSQPSSGVHAVFTAEKRQTWSAGLIFYLGNLIIY